MKLGFVAFPGTAFSSPHHYTVFMRGNDAAHVAPAASRCWSTRRPAQLTDSRELPWYVTALLISQPLHFGDYGGMPMKIIWALLDIATIVVLGSGLYCGFRVAARG